MALCHARGPNRGPKQADLAQRPTLVSFTAAVDQGIAGLAGAAVGGLIGVVGTLGAARLTGRDQKQTQHEHWRRQQRRDAYSQLVSQASEAIRLGSDALDAYEGHHPSCSGLAEQFSEAVSRLNTAEILISLEGPEEAAGEAGEMVTTLCNWEGCLERAIAIREGHFAPPGPEWSVSLRELMEHRERGYEALSAFTEVCRCVLDR